jgi:hypothetical protein
MDPDPDGLDGSGTEKIIQFLLLFPSLVIKFDFVNLRVPLHFIEEISTTVGIWPKIWFRIGRPLDSTPDPDPAI